MRAWRRLRHCVVAAMTVAALVTCLQMRLEPQQQVNVVYVEVPEDDDEPVPTNWRGLSQEQMSRLSALGRRLFLGDTSASPHLDRNFTILVWKHGPQLERRHIYQFGEQRHDPFEHCSVRNCRLTYESSELGRADAVLFHLHRTAGPESLPPRHAHAQQRWVFLTDENPHNTFTLSGKAVRMRDFNGRFNWSMTYRMDSDVPVPSGRTLPREGHEPAPRIPEKSKLAAILISNCAGKNKRWEYVQELRRHMQVDVYGSCGSLKCPGHFDTDCARLDDYKFYLAFENGDCREYVTEKAWWSAYRRGAVPVVLGAPLQDCAALLPPRSYLHARNFSSPASLARYLQYLATAPADYARFFTWTRKFRVVNEHGYFRSPVFHYCRLCEALNYNDPAPKTYQDLESFWSKDRDCLPPVI